jgi:glycosyltransferase involved in cell wall biosynthesis
VKATAMLVGERASLYHNLHKFAPLVGPCATVVTVHDLMQEIFPEYHLAVSSRPYRLHRWIGRTRVTRLIGISGTTVDDVHRLWGVPMDRLDVVHHGTTFIDPPADVEPPPGVPTDDSPTIVSPYNLEPRKNLDALIDAFEDVARSVPTARLVLYGRAAITPEREAKFRERLEASPAKSGVVLTGFLTDDQLAWLYGRSTVFAFPSLYEGFGYPVLEAMAAGAAVVARAASAMGEIMGDTGVAIEPIDAPNMARAILDLLNDEPRRVALGKAARQRAREFTVERMARLTLETYGRALGRPIAYRSA